MDAEARAGGGARAAEVMGNGGTVLDTARRRFRRALPYLLLALVVAAVVVLTVLTRSEEDTRPLSPGNASPGGSRALVQVLQDQGVEVIRPGSYAEARESLSEGATLFLSDPDSWLNDDQLAGLAGASARTVLAAPTEDQLDVLAPAISTVGPLPEEPDTVRAQCDDDAARAAGSITSGGSGYSGPAECFPASSMIDDSAGGSYVTTANQDTAVIGNMDVLTNGEISSAGNAALALRALGSEPVLVWYLPTTADLATTGTPVDARNLLPNWINPLMVWLLICSGIAMLWRGRRLGPLATEPLPVVVRAAETAEGRARLYQDSKSVQHAAANLRAATLSRLAVRLRLPRSSTRSEIIDAAAVRTGRPQPDLARIIDRIPDANRELVQFSQELLDLEKEINQQ
ncbi:DUF4350 domain-containing protein [Arthrobacter sp. H41]|uniref:DUF4350 domain-containing protein n=1 Tax=Arthrobacter sp. H41 TaxID=1312978 RepID=UPI0004B3B121|nr:DUF4350 domain-containing protein [Arthrobacter sp. H41]